MLKKEFEFILEDKLIYSHDGKAGLIAKKLLLRAPTTKLLNLSGQISSIVMSSLMNTWEKLKKHDDDKNKSKESNVVDDKLDGAGIYMLITGSSDISHINKLINLFQELILSDDICLVDGKEQLTLDLYNSFDSRETLRLIGDYIANFLLPSTMSK